MTDNQNRITPAPKPAKDPNRQRPAHKLNLCKGDVVRLKGFQDGRHVTEADIVVGIWFSGEWLQSHIESPLPKGQRPLFTVVSRANGGEA